MQGWVSLFFSGWGFRVRVSGLGFGPDLGLFQGLGLMGSRRVWF